MKRILIISFCFFLCSSFLFSQNPEESKKLFNLINDEREKKGLYLYKTDKNLSEIAEIRAKEIAEVFDSTRPDGSGIHTIYSENDIKVAYYGESIRSGYDTAGGIFNAMLKDNTDLSSMLDIDYTHIAIGIYKNSKNTYWAILYCSLAE